MLSPSGWARASSGRPALAFAKDVLDADFPIVADGHLDDRGVNVRGQQRSDLLEQLVQRQIGGQQKSRPSHEVPVTFQAVIAVIRGHVADHEAGVRFPGGPYCRGCVKILPACLL